MIHNDDIVSPGEGFDMHQHDNAEIVTWVLDGSLRHRDSDGKNTILHSGQAQAITAGRGVRHSEVNAAGYTSRSRLHVIQMWLPPDEENTDPRHGEADFSASIEHSKTTGEFFTVAAGSKHHAPLHIGSAGARLDISYLRAQATSQLELARYSHIFVASGSVTASIDSTDESGNADALDMHEGDVLRVEDLNSVQPTITFAASANAVIMVWRMSYSAKEKRTKN